MQLDRTEIVIRKRGNLELLDLSLLVLKRHFLKLAVAISLLGVPFLVLDVWLARWMVTEDAILAADSSLDAEVTVGLRYVAHLVAMFVIQFQILSLPATMVLGALVFYEPLPLGQLLRNLGQLWGRIVLLLGITRLGLIPFLLVPWMFETQPWESSAEIWFLFILLPASLVIRAFWPFAPEILGLERCPIRISSESKINYRSRSRFLHGPIQGDLLGRAILAAIHCGLLLVMLVGVAIFLQGVVTGSWKWNQVIYYVVIPMGLWLVGILMTVFRYLSYIDSRIQLEGWEIELRMRAEAIRLEQQEQPHVSTGSSVEEVLQT